MNALLASLDRTALRATVAEFLSGRHGVLAIVGSDLDGRHVAADAVCELTTSMERRLVRVRSAVDRPRSARELLFAAWLETTPAEQDNQVSGAVARLAFGTVADAITGICECLIGADKRPATFVFDTIDELGPIPTHILTAFSRLAEQAGACVILFVRQESNSRPPAAFRTAKLGDMPINDLGNSVLLNPALDDSRRKAALAVVRELRDCADSSGLVEAQFAYDFFDLKAQ